VLLLVAEEICAASSRRSGLQPRSAPQLGGGNEKWHIHGGNDQLISGILERLPRGVVRLSHRLVGLRERTNGRILCSSASGGRTRDVVADQVVLATPFTTLRHVDTSAIPIPALHRRAMNEQPMGSNAKFFLQYSRMIADYLASFEQVFPGSRSRYNGRAFFVWSSGDPYVLGAYSYLAVGQYTAFNGIQGRQAGRLHFAGEQTS
jgi:monoamine oxidase